MTGEILGEFQLAGWQVNPLTGALVSEDGEEIIIPPMVMKLLIYLSSRPGELVSNDDLINHVWEGVYVSESSLYYTINKLRAALGDEADHPVFIETIPKRGYRLIAEVAYDNTPTGFATFVIGLLSPNQKSTPLMWSIMGVIILLFSAILYLSPFAPPKNTPKPNSIAVLPFVNMSGDPANEYFSDGVAEEILNLLAQIPDLHVTSRSSAFQFKGADIHIPTVASQLGVANVVEGSIRRSGTRLRIAAQLIDARTDQHLWSAIYDREVDDIFAVQDEISAAIVEALRTKLALEITAPEEQTFVAQNDAHEAFLRGRYLVVQRSRTSIEGAIREFEKAIALDPNYALAHAELGIAILMLIWDSYGDFTPSDAIKLASPHVEKAISLNPSLAEAYAAKGLIAVYQQKPEEGIDHYKQAIKLKPNYSIVYSWMANLMEESLGAYKESFQTRNKALLLNPLSKSTRYHKVLELIALNQLEEADKELEKLASFAPAFHAHALGQRKAVGGQWANAALGNLKALSISSDFKMSKYYLSHEFAKMGLVKETLSVYQRPHPTVRNKLGRPEGAVKASEWWITKEPDSISSHRSLALARAGVGDYIRAQPILEEMWQLSGGQISSKGVFQITHATALIAVRRATGKGGNVNELIVAIENEAMRLRNAGIVRTSPRDFPFDANMAEGLAYYLAGQSKQGLALIDKSVREGYFIWPNEAYLKILYEDPTFAPILAIQKARQVQERKKFLAVVCNRNPYAEIWQPSEGTCEAYSAEQ